MAQTVTSDKLKVFISYSRRDSSEFAEELLAGLELAGFAAFLDRHDIAAGEEWEVRLGPVIRQADTVVCAVSPESVKSPRCEWEVQRALAEAKRVLPVIFKSVPDADIPAELQKRQFIRFDSVSGITRLHELAQRWEERGRPVSQLLRGEELAAAQIWTDRWKPGAPAITDVMQRLITASRTQEALALVQSKAAQRRRRWTEFATAFFAIAAVLALVAWWQQDWLREKSYALKDTQVLAAADERALKPQSIFKECADCPD